MTTQPRRGRLLFVGIALLSVPLIGGTFAASITLNDNSGVEFGQGQAVIAACDPTIDIYPTSTYDGSAFSVATVVLEGVDLENTSGSTDCLNTTFTVTLRGSSSTLDTVVFVTGADADGLAITTGDWGIGATAYGDDTTLTLTRIGAAIDAADLGKIALETSD